MSLPLTCPQGHRWDPPPDTPINPDDPPCCPVCGERAAGSAVTPTTSATVPDLRPLAPAVGAPSLEGYEILGELGRGGMGVVYKARQARLERLVAVKVLPEEAGRDPAFAERFAREARALARLNHPGIVTVFDFGQAGGHSYLVMEYVEGSDLRQRLRTGRMPPDEARALALQVCDALQYAHEEGVVHRDIKPENILLDRRGRVKIADFGLAKLLTRSALEFTLTRPSQIMGTLHYMAPEQFENRPDLDHRADVYAVGVLLYEALTGRLPIGRFPPPSETPGVDPRFDTVVLRALERDPERRYQQIADLRAALESPTPTTVEVVPAAAVTAVPAGRAETLVLPRVPARTESVAAPDAVRRAVRWPALGLMILGVLTALSAPLLQFSVNEPLAWLFGNLITPVAGAVTVAGGMAAWAVRRWPLALVGAVVALVPYTPLWCLGLPVGVWALVVLFRQDVRTAFKRTQPAPDDADVLPWRRSAETAAGFGLTAVFGAYVSLLWPWAALTVFDTSGVSHALRVFYSYESWRVLLTGVAALAPAVLLLKPSLRAWSSPLRPALFLVPGLLALAVGGACVGWPGRVDVVAAPGRGVGKGFLIEAEVYRTPLTFEAEVRTYGSRESQIIFRGPLNAASSAIVPRGVEESDERLLRRLRLTAWAGAYAALALGGALTAFGLAELWDRFRPRH